MRSSGHRKARAAGIPVMIFDRQITSTPSELHLGRRNGRDRPHRAAEITRLLTRRTARQGQGPANLGDPATLPPSISRRASRSGWRTSPGVKIISAPALQWEANNAATSPRRLLTDPDMDVIFWPRGTSRSRWPRSSRLRARSRRDHARLVERRPRRPRSHPQGLGAGRGRAADVRASAALAMLPTRSSTTRRSRPASMTSSASVGVDNREVGPEHQIPGAAITKANVDDSPADPNRRHLIRLSVSRAECLPDQLTSSTLALVIAARILMFGPLLDCHLRLEADDVILAGLDLLVLTTLSATWRAPRLRVHRLLDLDLLPPLRMSEADGGAVRRDEHDLAGLLALSLEDRGHATRGARRQKMTSMSGSVSSRSSDVAGVVRLHCRGRRADDLPPGLSAIRSSKPFWISRCRVAGSPRICRTLPLGEPFFSGEEPCDLGGRDVADLDRSGDRGEVAGVEVFWRFRRSSPGCRRHAPSRCRLDRIEIDRGDDHRLRRSLICRRADSSACGLVWPSRATTS